MEARDEQAKKARPPAEVRPAGRVREAREEQLWKAPSPMEVMPVGRPTRVREAQLWVKGGVAKRREAGGEADGEPGVGPHDGAIRD